MSVFFTDEIIIVNYTTDDWGVKTSHQSAPIAARVEDYNRLITDNRGQEVLAEMVIFCDTSRDITYEDFIIVTKKGGQAFNQPNTEYKIKKCPLIHGFSSHHKEIYI
jgi:hypothetical protein